MDRIREFAIEWEKSGMTVTYNVHVLITHVPIFIHI